MFSCPYAFRLTHCERRRRWAGRRPDFVLKTMPEPPVGFAAWSKDHHSEKCVEDELQPIARQAKSLKFLAALKFAFGAPSLLSSMTKLQGSSTPLAWSFS